MCKYAHKYAQVMCKYSTILHEVLEDPWILVSIGFLEAVLYRYLWITDSQVAIF